MTEKPNPKSLIGRAYEVINELRGGITSDDEVYSLRQVMSNINAQLASSRKAELEQSVRDGAGVNPQIRQTFRLKLVAQDTADCQGCMGGEYVLKTAKLPVFIPMNGKPTITYLGGVGKTAPVAMVTSPAAAMRYVLPKQYHAPTPAAWLSGMWASFALPPAMAAFSEMIAEGVPENPAAVNTALCYDYWSEHYPMLEDEWARIKPVVMGTFGKSVLTTEPNKDRVNNSTDR